MRSVLKFQSPFLQLLALKNPNGIFSAQGTRIAAGYKFFSTNTISHSSSQAEQSSVYPPNSSIEPTSVNNRNPRNLEKLRIGDKPRGWNLERESRNFWNKLTLDITSKHISASIVHQLGQIPITVSTQEWCLRKFLYSTSDASAAKLVGQVLSQRCLQAGITEVQCYFPQEQRTKEKVSVFLNAIEEAGIALNEPKQVPTDWNVDHWATPERPWEIHEGVDDSFSIAAKMPEPTIRLKKIPKLGKGGRLPRKPRMWWGHPKRTAY